MDFDFIWLGTEDYEKALEFQLDIADQVHAQLRLPTIIACQHEPVITLGKRSQALSDLLVSVQELRDRDIKIVATDRGGHATLHGPGQLVLYPIIPLAQLKIGVRSYVESLERATAMFLAEHGVEVTRGYEPGLWVKEKKIASFGIRIRRGVSLHGCAINICNDLELFSLIKQCGQNVGAANLETEMRAFMDEIPSWDLKEESKKWNELFLEEIRSFNENKTHHEDKSNVGFLNPIEG